MKAILKYRLFSGLIVSLVPAIGCGSVDVDESSVTSSPVLGDKLPEGGADADSDAGVDAAQNAVVQAQAAAEFQGLRRLSYPDPWPEILAPAFRETLCVPNAAGWVAARDHWMGASFKEFRDRCPNAAWPKMPHANFDGRIAAVLAQSSEESPFVPLCRSLRNMASTPIVGHYLLEKLPVIGPSPATLADHMSRLAQEAGRTIKYELHTEATIDSIADAIDHGRSSLILIETGSVPVRGPMAEWLVKKNTLKRRLARMAAKKYQLVEASPENFPTVDYVAPYGYTGSEMARVIYYIDAEGNRQQVDAKTLEKMWSIRSEGEHPTTKAVLDEFGIQSNVMIVKANL